MKMSSLVCTIANNLVKQGVSRSAAMVRAWITVKLRRIETKTVGVTGGRRQGVNEVGNPPYCHPVFGSIGNM